MRDYLLDSPVTFYPLYFWVLYDRAVTPASRIYIAGARVSEITQGARTRSMKPAAASRGQTMPGSSRTYTPPKVERTDDL